MGEAAGKGKERWPQVRLGDYIQQVRGVSYTPPDVSDTLKKGFVPLFRAHNIQDDGLNFEDLVYVNKKKISKTQMIQAGDILVCASSGSKNLVGKTAQAQIDYEMSFGAFCKVVRVCNDNLDPIFLGHYFKTPKYRQMISGLSSGANINNIRNEHVANMKIPLPPLPEQRRIAAVLDQVSSLIALRKAQLSKLDLLVKARFVEMFGDPVKNEMGWNIVSLDEIAEISSGITKGRKTKEQDLKKVPYLSVSNVKDGYIDVSHVKTILATQNEIKQYKLLPYDVLMTEGGDPDKLGRGAILYQPPENCIHQNHIFRVRFDKNKINPVFFEEYLKHPAAKKYFLKCAKQTTGIATINMKQLSSLPVLLPPLEHQHVFSQFKQDTLKLKLAYNQTLEKLEILMKSLSLEYFG